MKTLYQQTNHLAVDAKNMTKPKYEVGYCFTVMNTVKCEIVEVIKTKNETGYIFQLFDNPVFKSFLKEPELENVLNAPQHES